jgi:hypothetical protein
MSVLPFHILTTPVETHKEKGNYYNIGTHISIARQRLGKNIPVEGYAHNNRTPIIRQRISKQAFSTIQRLCFPRVPCQAVIKGQTRSFGEVVMNWVEFWRCQFKVIEKK